MEKKIKDKAPSPARYTGPAKIDVSKALKMYMAGVPQVDIAKVFGVSRQAVSNALKPFKIKHPEAIQAYEQNKAELLSEKELMALEALDEEKLKKASGRDLAIIYGTLFDKNRLERGKSSQNLSIFSRAIAAACEDEGE